MNQLSITALMHRARTGILINLLLTGKKTDTFDFWQGQFKALTDLRRGVGQRLAIKDAGLAGYQPPSALVAATLGLDDDIYRLPRREIEKLIAEAGIQIAAHSVSQLDFVAAHEFVDGAVAVVDLNSEHAAAAVASNDRSGAHAGSVATPPAIGQPWLGQGGTYAGIARGAPGQPDRHLIVPTAASASFNKLAWGGSGKDEPGTTSEWDGHANTRALVASKHAHQAAEACAALEIDGHRDFYLPSRRELVLCFANVPELFERDGWYWSSTQDSRSSAFVQDFEFGYSYWYGKGYEHRVRACRGFTLESLTTFAEGGAS